MPKTNYTELYEITDLQRWIMKYVTYWASVYSTPIAKQEVVDEMKRRGKKYGAVDHALLGLVELGYVRRAITIAGESNKTYYVQLRTI